MLRLWILIASTQILQEVQPATAGSNWSYRGDSGPDKWPELFSNACAGRRQSPVHITTQHAVYDGALGSISVGDVSTGPTRYSLINNGHSAQITIERGKFKILGLPSDYRVQQFHFHWGGDETRGSEHRIDSKAYPMEMHVVSFDARRFTSLGSAINQTRGLAVLGVLFQISETDNPSLDTFVAALTKVKDPEVRHSVTVTTNLTRLLPSNMDDYYRYDGSLTTPGCYESVVWSVFKETQSISKKQLAIFRDLLEPSTNLRTSRVNIVDNYRPVQALNHRIVWRSFLQPDVNKITNQAQHTWSYDGPTGPTNWAKLFPDKCSGMKQSPINIATELTELNPDLTDIVIIDPPQANLKYTIKNNGHTVQVDVADDSFKIMGGNLPSTYTVAQFHFHWGSFHSQGSEHLINGNAFPLEMHLVSYDSERFTTIGEAMLHENGLAVFATFYHISEYENAALRPILKAMTRVQHADNTNILMEDRVSMLSMLPDDTSSYYRYNGSLTTPSCYESVIWTVFKQNKYLSTTQLAMFRELYASGRAQGGPHSTSHPPETLLKHRVIRSSAKSTKIVDNFRPVQPLNGRTVWRSFPGKMSNHWSYSGSKGPQQWSTISESCRGKQQSPINIIRSKALYDKHLTGFSLYQESASTKARLSMINNGHTVQVILKGDHYVRGGGLVNPYRAVQIHFHWGGSDDRGSEHTINGESSPMELHIVSYDDTKYTQFSEAAVNQRGLAVLGILFKISTEDNPILSNLVSALDTIADPDIETMVSLGALSPSQLLPFNLDRYYRYDGSLTTPGCHESVVWSIFTEKQTISRRQLEAFRRVKTFKKYRNVHDSSHKNTDSTEASPILMTDIQQTVNTTYRKQHASTVVNPEFLSDNYRPTQPLYSRKVFKSFINPCYRIHKVGDSLRCVKLHEMYPKSEQSKPHDGNQKGGNLTEPSHMDDGKSDARIFNGNAVFTAFLLALFTGIH